MANQQATLLDDMKWLGGFIDGDGWITIGVNHMVRERALKRKRGGGGGTWLNPRIGVDNVDEKLVDEVQKIIVRMGFQPYAVCIQHPSKPHAKKAFALRLQRLSSISKFLGKMLPYIRGKQRQAELVKEFCDIRLATNGRGKVVPYGHRELEIAYEVRELNQRGVLRGHERDTVRDALKGIVPNA